LDTRTRRSGRAQGRDRFFWTPRAPPPHDELEQLVFELFELEYVDTHEFLMAL
jgi:hypothetical protein